MPNAKNIKRPLFIFAAAFLLLWIIFPIYIMVKISVSPPSEVMTQHPSFLTKDPTLDHWKEVLRGGAIRQPLRKSLTVAFITTLLTLLLAVPGAYGISRLPKRWRYTALLALFSTRAFPEVSIALPMAIQFVKWNLVDNEVGLSLAHMVRVLPIATWILVGVFRSIPKELEEQAEIDGCTRLGTLQKIVTPLSLGGVSVAAIFSWLFSWDEFTYALYLCLSQPALPLNVHYYINRGNWFLTATYATVITVPAIFITYSLQKFLKAGYTAGAVKG